MYVFQDDPKTNPNATWILSSRPITYTTVQKVKFFNYIGKRIDQKFLKESQTSTERLRNSNRDPKLP